ncbi:MAG: substrate-binding domain-containing protein [Finegoldia sp.]|nr:substrate-binding domain-containing protein [Finegoldia sp.]
MKNFKKLVMLCMVLVAGLFVTACGSNNQDNSADGQQGTQNTQEQAAAPADGGSKDAPITVVSREDGSGTRGAFTEITGVLEKDANGNENDKTVASAAVQNSTNGVMMTVGQDPNAIGYISLGSLNDSVKALKVEGVEATSEKIQSGDYKISRPFNIAYKDGLNDVAKDFLVYIASKEAQDVISQEGYEQTAGDHPAYQKQNDLSGKVRISGSTSVTPLMEKLTEAYKAIYPNVEFEIQSNGSSAGMTDTMGGAADLGMASRELKDEEAKELKSEVIAIDGIAVIVNKENAVEDLTMDQIKQIYTGEIANWSEVTK